MTRCYNNIYNDLNLEIEEEATDDVENIDQGQSQKQAPPLKIKN